ncbi:hypothetical protein A7H1H_1173 [Aliarcobacter butzleri 7h1h]|uniref:hypothetical protein n=1 Tax=Aliarcobacter butzleri TaxID=28197 RepID=UPI00030CBE3A|nr:hypothetical protein [Aliarcobacter butzleri]RBQ31436.1 hypothetical protein CRU92_06595 [Arcobacter sp. FW59]AGR77473.1 hypothetical protein A7H1H_1173 [Aliarcobacter butzleri 7h1h]MDN5072013.1 hypothetical protein [Aliarcobacter butzleri]MDN5120107.1 hypothetical protein [Aliarcobacter butzleri]MDN5130537.1 hypothetical protein [Aliarcobacter butzleri]
MENIIREAIANKQLLEFIYNDKRRVVEPYTFGCSHKGDDTLSAFQIEGGSNSSRDLGWRQFILENIESLVISETSFNDIRDGYNPNDSRMSEIYITI